MGSFISTRDIRREDLTGRLFEGNGEGTHYGVLVLHGAGGGGGYEREYARYLAEHGYTAFCVEYFGAPGTPEALTQIPLTYFGRAIEWLIAQPEIESGHVGVVGFSRGGEAALLVGAHFEQIGVVVGYVPSGLAFPAPTWMDGVDEEVAAWTIDGEPVPYIPVDEFVETSDKGLKEPLKRQADDDPSAVECATQARRAQAAIEVERIDGPVLLISGEADRVWPSADLSTVAVDRLDANHHPWPYRHLSFQKAGHAIRVPYRFDDTDDPTARHKFGGTNQANARASAEAWWAVLDYLQRGLRDRNEYPSSPS